MRIAALYDVHGNLPALEAVLSAVERADPELIVVGGDVALGPMPAETLDRLSRLQWPIAYVRGNADRELAAAYDELDSAEVDIEDQWWRRLSRWAAGRLSPAQRDLLASFRETVAVDVDGLGPVLFCHGSPRSDEEIITAVTSEQRLRTILAGVEQSLVVCGHTHHQFDRRIAGTRIVNAGSVGMPYEGSTGFAYWALLGPDVALRRTTYDFTMAVEAMRATGFDAIDGLIADLSAPPTAQTAAEYFEAAATGRTA